MAEDTEAYRTEAYRTEAHRTGSNRNGDRSPTAVASGLLKAVRYEESPEPYLTALAAFDDEDLESVRRDRRTGLAFWLNVYNAAAQLLLERRPGLFDSRIRFFRTTAVTVAGVDLSLDDIEHGNLRGRRSKYGLGHLPRLARSGLDPSYRLDVDPRIHFALNCGAASCPAVLAYDSKTIDETLDTATRSHLEQTVEYDPARDRVRAPRPCLWFLGDFGGPSGVREFLREYDQIPNDASPSLRFTGYDWTKDPRNFAP